jgi:serine/threonine protein kinase
MNDEVLINTISRCTKERCFIQDVKKILSGKFRPILTLPRGKFLLMIDAEQGDVILGQGESKKAMFAINLHTGELDVVTISKKHLCPAEKWAILKREITLLKEVEGIPEILQLKGAQIDDETSYLIVNYCNGGMLFNELLSRTLSLPETVQLALDITKGVKELHARGIIHRDLKPDNIFLHKEPNGTTRAIIGDLDVACKETDLEALKELYGNPLWISPEKAKIISSPMTPAEQIPFWQKATTTKDDIWALGTLFFTLFRGGRLNWQTFSSSDEPRTSIILKCAQLTQEALSKQLQSSYLPPLCIPLIEKMMQIDPLLRPNAQEVYDALCHIHTKLKK